MDILGCSYYLFRPLDYLPSAARRRLPAPLGLPSLPLQLWRAWSLELLSVLGFGVLGFWGFRGSRVSGFRF